MKLRSKFVYHPSSITVAGGNRDSVEPPSQREVPSKEVPTLDILNIERYYGMQNNTGNMNKNTAVTRYRAKIGSDKVTAITPTNTKKRQSIDETKTDTSEETNVATGIEDKATGHGDNPEEMSHVIEDEFNSDGGTDSDETVQYDKPSHSDEECGWSDGESH